MKLPKWRTVAAVLREQEPIKRPDSRYGKAAHSEAVAAHQADAARRKALVAEALEELGDTPDASLSALFQRRCLGLFELAQVGFLELARLEGAYAPFWGRKVNPDANVRPELLEVRDLDHLAVVLGLPPAALMFPALGDMEAWALAVIAAYSSRTAEGRMALGLLAELIPGYDDVRRRLLQQRLVVEDIKSQTIALAAAGAALLVKKSLPGGGTVYQPNGHAVRIFFSAPGVRVDEYEGREPRRPPGLDLFHTTTPV